jgi:hypothetical protein
MVFTSDNLFDIEGLLGIVSAIDNLLSVGDGQEGDGQEGDGHGSSRMAEFSSPLNEALSLPDSEVSF